MSPYRLPYMTDPLGAHWGQPRDIRDRVQLYETHAAIDERAWLLLPRYDRTNPNGVYAGKVWRSGPFLCWYGRPHRPQLPDGKLGREVCKVGRIRALVQGPGTNMTAPTGDAWKRAVNDWRRANGYLGPEVVK